MQDKQAKKIIRNTIADYNRISPLWSTKRSFLPSDMKEIAENISDGDTILDLGCGNGIFYEAVQGMKISYLGADPAKQLIEIAKIRFPDASFKTIASDKLPFNDQSFDKVVCLSVLHHIPTDKYRIQLLKETLRVLKVGGKLIITVWNISDQMISWFQENKDQLKINNIDSEDIYYPFKNEQGKTQVLRYLHCFDEEKLSRTLSEAGFLVEKTWVIVRGAGKFSNVMAICHRQP